jgi:ethanolamine utilization protein EutA
VLFESEVLLTPYRDDASIDAAALGVFIERQYALAGLAPEAIDTGALILTGVAVRRSNARAIGELFAGQAGKFVSVSAGDALETTLAAFGSGAAARSIREAVRVMNIDIGGGTSKVGVCEAGELAEMTAVDIGARIVAFDGEGRVTRIEEAGRRFAAMAGLTLDLGAKPDSGGLQAMVELMADALFEVIGKRSLSPECASLLRLDPLRNEVKPAVVTFSGGVSEYIYDREPKSFGDLGPMLAQAVVRRVRDWGVRIERPDQGIRATVVGASQYTIQVSGATIYVAPHDTLPLRNIPVITPALQFDEEVDSGAIASAIQAALRRMDLHEGEQAVAMCYRFQGSAMYGRLDAFCRGVVRGLEKVLSKNSPLILVGDNDIGGLVGIHFQEELKLPNPIVSIDGITLKEFDFIDIGALLETSGAVPVVIKSLVFPTSSTLGRIA